MPNKAAQTELSPESVRDLLAISLVPGIGPVLADRLLHTFGDPASVLGASAAALERVRGVGASIAAKLATGIRAARSLADDELHQLETLGARAVFKGHPGYPVALAQLPDAPLTLFVRDEQTDLGTDGLRMALAIVGSRKCTSYGIEQAERFAHHTAGAGLTIVSGGARGIDTAAHRGALRAKAGPAGRTIVVLGCGLAHTYPPENRALFDAVVEAGGAVLSELPCKTPPKPENFPSRNRLISGMALGTLVIEAARRSGALITARVAAEEHGREVMALPGRVDSPSSAGSLDLIRKGGAHLVMEPADVLSILEQPSFHASQGTFDDRYDAAPQPLSELSLDPDQKLLLEALDEAKTEDQLEQSTGLTAARIRVAATALEIGRRIRREGAKLARAGRQ